MSNDDFKADQKLLGMRNREMADALGLSLGHVESLRAGRKRVTEQTEILITLLKEKAGK